MCIISKKIKTISTKYKRSILLNRGPNINYPFIESHNNNRNSAVYKARISVYK